MSDPSLSPHSPSAGVRAPDPRPKRYALIADDGDGKRGIPFGMYAEVEQPGIVQVGDAVDVLS